MKRRNLAVVWIVWGVVLSLVESLDPLAIDAQGANQVGLVIDFGDGSIATHCLGFTEVEIGGYDVLMRSGLQVVASQSSGMGVTICAVEGGGCPANNCFCECSGSTCTYWSYWRLADGEWSYASVGASVRRVRSGDVEGWAWGQGDPPPVVSFEQICAPAATATSTPTLTSAPTATAQLPTGAPQPADTATVLPTATWTPTRLPTQSPTPSPSAVPRDTATLPAPSATPSATPTPQSVAARTATPTEMLTVGTTRPSPTPRPRQATPTLSAQAREERSNYVLFGVLLALLIAMVFIIVVRRKT